MEKNAKAKRQHLVSTSNGDEAKEGRRNQTDPNCYGTLLCSVSLPVLSILTTASDKDKKERYYLRHLKEYVEINDGGSMEAS